MGYLPLPFYRLPYPLTLPCSWSALFPSNHQLSLLVRLMSDGKRVRGVDKARRSERYEGRGGLSSTRTSRGSQGVPQL